MGNFFNESRGKFCTQEEANARDANAVLIFAVGRTVEQNPSKIIDSLPAVLPVVGEFCNVGGSE